MAKKSVRKTNPIAKSLKVFIPKKVQPKRGKGAKIRKGRFLENLE